MAHLSVQNLSKEPDADDDSTDRARAIASTFRGEDDKGREEKSRERENRLSRTNALSRIYASPQSPTFSGFRLGSPIKSPSELKELKAANRNARQPQKRRSPNRDAEESRRVSRRTDTVCTPSGGASSHSPGETMVEPTDSGTEHAELGNSSERHLVEDNKKSPGIPRQGTELGRSRGRDHKYEEGESRSLRDDKVHDEIVVPSEVVRFIIGRQGESIKAITAASGAYISMDRSFPGPDRKFDITGYQSQVSHCRELMLRKMEEVQDKGFDSRPSAGLHSSKKSNVIPTRSSETTEETYKMWIPQHKIGMLIGTGGATIRSINEKSGAFATVRNDKVDGDRKLVLIHGPSSCIEIARDMIVDIINGASEGVYKHSRADEYQRRDYDAEERPEFIPHATLQETKAVYIPHNAVRHVIGKNGTMIKQIQVQTGAKVRVASDEETGDHPERLITISGTSRVIDHAQHMITKLVDRGLTLEREANGWGRRDEQPESIGEDDSRRNIGPLRRHKKVSEETFSLSAEHIGLLIGKGGVTIKDFQYRSGANIEVTGKSESDREGNSRKVSIVGTRAQVKIAKILIEERLGLDEDGEDRGTMLDNQQHSTAPAKESGRETERKAENEDVGMTSAIRDSATGIPNCWPVQGPGQPNSENMCSSEALQKHQESRQLSEHTPEEPDEVVVNTSNNPNPSTQVTSQSGGQEMNSGSKGHSPAGNDMTSHATKVNEKAEAVCEVTEPKHAAAIAEVNSKETTSDAGTIPKPLSTHNVTGHGSVIPNAPVQPQQNPYPQYPPHSGHFPHYQHMPPPMYGGAPLMQYPYYGGAPVDHTAGNNAQPPHPPVATSGPGPQASRPHESIAGSKPLENTIPTNLTNNANSCATDINPVENAKIAPHQQTGGANGQNAAQTNALPSYYGYGQPGYPMMYPPPPMYGGYAYGQPNPAGHPPPPHGHYMYPPPAHQSQGFPSAPQMVAPTVNFKPGQSGGEPAGSRQTPQAASAGAAT